MRRRVAWTLLLLGFSLVYDATGAAGTERQRADTRASVVQAIEERIATSGAEAISVAVHDLATGREILIRPDVSFHPASTFKVGIMLELFRQARAKRFSLDDPLPVKNEFRSIADGSPFSLTADNDGETDLYKRVGESLPIRDLIERMITRSSNLATNLLIARAGAGNVTKFMHRLGAKDMTVRRGVEDDKAFAQGLNNATTARSLMQILTKLAQRRAVSPSDSDAMIEILKRQQYNEGIPAGLPAGVMVAHKTGEITRVYHDAAIVYPPGRKPYVLVVLTRGLSEDKDAPVLVAALSRLIYDALPMRP